MRVIYVTGHLHDADFVQRVVDPGRSAIVVEPCPAPERALASLGDGSAVDAVLVDESLAGGEAIGLITTLRAKAADLPIVLLTAMADEQVAARALVAGADDCVLKREQHLARLGPLFDRLRQRDQTRGARRLPRVLHLDLPPEAEHELVSTGRLLLERVATSDQGALVTPAGEPAQWVTADALLLRPDGPPVEAAVRLRRLRTQYPNLPIFVMASESDAATYQRLGVVDVWPPAAPVDRLLRSLERSTLTRHLALENSVLRSKERRLRALVETVPEAVLLAGADGSVLAVNQAGLALLGAQSARDVVGHELTSFVSADDRPAAVHFLDAVASGESRTLGAAIRTEQGTSRTIELRAVPFQREPGKPAAALMVLHEVSEPAHRAAPPSLVGATGAQGLDEELRRLRSDLDAERAARRLAEESTERVLDTSLAEVAAWKERVEVLEHERDRWRRDAESASALGDSLASARELVAAEKAMWEQSRRELEDRLAKLQQQSRHVETERDDLSAEAARLRTDVASLGAQRNAWEGERTELRVHLDAALAEASARSAALEQAAADLADRALLLDRLAAADGRTRSLEAELQAARDQLLDREAAAAELPAAVEHQRALENQLNRSHESLRALEAMIADLNAALEALRAQAPAREAELADLQDTVTRLETQLLASEERRRAGEDQSVHWRSESEVWRARATEQAEDVVRLEAAVRAFEAELATARDRALADESARYELRGLLADRDARVGDLASALERERTQAPELATRVADLQKALEEAASALERERTLAQEAEARLTDLQRVAVERQTEAEATAERARAQELLASQLQAEVEDWRARTRHQTERADHLDAVARDLEARFEAAKEQARQSESRLDQALAELERALAERDARILDLSNEVQARAALATPLQAQGSRQAERADQLDAMLRHVQAQLEAAREQARSAEARWQASRAELELAIVHRDQHLRDAEAHLHGRDASAAQLTSERDEWKARATQRAQDAERLGARLRELSLELDEARAVAADRGEPVDRHARWILDSAGIGLVETTLDGRIVRCNNTAARLWDAFSTDLVGTEMPRAVFDAAERSSGRAPRSRRFEICLEHSNGRLYYLLGVVDTRTLADGSQLLDWVLADISEQRLSARRKWFLRRMESIAQFLTSAASECTPLMGEVAGAVEDLACALEEAGGTRDVERTREAIVRTRAVLQQLAGVAQRKARRPVVIDLNQILERGSVLLGRLAGEDSPCDIQLSERPLLATVDPGEMEQALAALVVWSRESLPAGGTITVAASGARAESGEGLDAVVRQVAALTVTAEGFGAQAAHPSPLLDETLQRIGANLDVRHEPGVRTTFVLRLARIAKVGQPAAPPVPAAAATEERR